MRFLIEQTINGVSLGGVYALYALGFGLVLANMKVFHVAHAGVFSLSAIAAWWVTARLGVPLALALPMACVAGASINIAAYWLLIRHLEERRDKELAAFVSSLGGLLILIEIGAKLLDRRDVRLPFSVVPSNSISILGFRISIVQIMILVIAVASYLVLRVVLSETQIGREIRAVAADRESAEILGVSSDRTNVIVFGLSGALGGLAAVMIALAFNVIHYQLGEVYLVIAIAVMVIGGFGSVTGTFLAGLGVGVITSLTTAYVSSSYKEGAVFLILLAFLVFRPQGLFSSGDLSKRA